MPKQLDSNLGGPMYLDNVSRSRDYLLLRQTQYLTELRPAAALISTLLTENLKIEIHAILARPAASGTVE
jgi:hypothetical protein